MDNDNAQAMAAALRALYKMRVITFDQLDRLVNKIQVRLWKDETKAP